MVPRDARSTIESAATPQRSALPIIRTKLHRPPVTDQLVCRTRLHERMDRGLQIPLTVVSAPAGYGKSTMVSHWAESLDRPCAWLSLDTTDSDLDVFMEYVLAAVQTSFPGACTQTDEMVSRQILCRFQCSAPAFSTIWTLSKMILCWSLTTITASTVPRHVHDLLSFVLDHPPRFPEHRDRDPAGPASADVVFTG